MLLVSSISLLLMTVGTCSGDVFIEIFFVLSFLTNTGSSSISIDCFAFVYFVHLSIFSV